MLPAAHRMRSAADFTRTTRRGTKVSRGCVVLSYLPTDDDSPARLGLVVGKAVGGSVIRHRTARRIRAAAAPLIRSLPRGTLIVVRALPGADRDPALGTDLATALVAAAERAPA